MVRDRNIQLPAGAQRSGGLIALVNGVFGYGLRMQIADKLYEMSALSTDEIYQIAMALMEWRADILDEERG
jgi:hypothetical protein